MTKTIEELGIEHKEDGKGNVVISMADALKNSGEIWGEEEKCEENPDTDQDTPA